MTETITPHTAMGQEDLIAGLIRQLDDAKTFLRETKGIRVSPYAEAPIHYFAASPEEVDEIAAAIGAEPRWNANHYSVQHKFGPELSYQAVYICKCHRGHSAAPAAKTEGAAA